MNPAAIARARLAGHHIAGTRLTTPREIVSFMGAMQAQDFAMSLWAVGIRLPGATTTDIQAALDRGEILRTHVLRPTWHLVAPDDIAWMLALTAPNIIARLKSRHQGLGLTGNIFSKSQAVLEKALQDGQHATRQELIAAFEQAGIPTDENRTSHLLMRAELDGLICSGARRGNKLTYALLAGRAPQAKSLSKEEALAALAARYFSSHGPATAKDFAWWSGLPAGDFRLALDLVKDSLLSETFEGQTYWWSPSTSVAVAGENSLHLLPAYDEYIIGYQERSAVLPEQDFKKAVSSNGVFWPVVLVDGQARGVWKRTVKKEGVVVEVEWFAASNIPSREATDKASNEYGRFLESKSYR